MAEWISMLKGRKIWIKGNHFDPEPNSDCVIKELGGIRFVLIHNPEDLDFRVPNSWTIHGHTHSKTPFMDEKLKRVNVSVEAIGYVPKELNDIRNEVMKLM